MLTVLAAPAPGVPGIIDPELRARLATLADGETIPVIVELADKADLERFRPLAGARRRAAMLRALRDHAALTQLPWIETLRARGVVDPVELWLINGLAFDADAPLIAELAARSGVASIREDRAITLDEATNGVEVARAERRGPAAVVREATRGTAPVEWNIDAVNAPSQWSQGFDGAGVVVAILDSGVWGSHPDFAARWRSAGGWFDPHGEHASPADVTGHGTQVLGLLLGGETGGTAIGVAPGATWIAAKIFNDSDVTTYSAIHQSFQWTFDPDDDPDTDDAPDIVNNSWGLIANVNQCILEFRPDIQALKLAGIAVVFSAGNAGSGASPTSLSPANNPEGYAVGMVDEALAVDAQSSRGPSACDLDTYPELVAPGVFVWTTDLIDEYTEVLGTSFAAPHVAGAMALLLQRYPAATVGELESALEDAAVDLGTAGPDNESGYGLLDVSMAATVLGSYPCPDIDGDGRGNGAGCPAPDCDDGDGEVWGPPGAVTAIDFAGDHQTLSWAPPADAGGTAGGTVYDVLRSADASDFLGATCLESDDAGDTLAVDSDVPPSGTAFFYAVRAENACGAGPGPDAVTCP